MSSVEAARGAHRWLRAAAGTLLVSRRVPLFAHEVLGTERLRELARVLYHGDEDPSAVTRTEKPYTFGKSDGAYEVRLLLPFAAKGEIGLFKKNDELVIEVGTFRRHIGLPTSMAAMQPISRTATAIQRTRRARVADRHANTPATAAKKKPSMACWDFAEMSTIPAMR